MNWRDKLAVMKLAGFNVYQTRSWKPESQEYFRYVCEVDDDYPIYGAGDTKAQAVNKAWIEYIKGVNNEKVGRY